MLRMKKLAIIGTLTLSIFSLPTFAVMSVPCGWYIEANAGATKISDISYPGSASTDGVGGNVNIGYKFMPYAAAEIGYTRYANTSIKDPSTDTRAASDKHYSYDIAARGILPIVNSGFEAFAKLGAQRVASSVSIKNETAAQNIGITSGSTSKTGVYLGTGIQYYFTPEFAANIQWQRAKGNSSTGTLDLWSLGVSFIVD